MSNLAKVENTEEDKYEARRQRVSQSLVRMYHLNYKQDKEAVVKRLWDSVVNGDTIQLGIDEISVVLADMLKMPKAQSCTSNLFQWLSRAAAKNDARFALNSVYKDDQERWIATCGHRLHMFNANHEWTDNYKSGFYIPCNKASATRELADDQDLRYPKFEEVFDTFKFIPRWNTEYLTDLEHGTGENGYSEGSKRIDHIKIGQHGYNLKYVRDAISYGTPNMLRYCQDVESGILLLNILHENVNSMAGLTLSAIVMPMRL